MNSKNKELINWLVTVGVILVFLALSYFVVVSYFLTPPQKVEDCSHDLIYLSAIINAEADTTDTVDMFLVGSSVLNYFVNPKTMLDKEFKNQLKQKQIVGMTVNHVFFGE